MPEDQKFPPKFQIGDWVQYRDGIYRIDDIFLNHYQEYTYTIYTPNVTTTVPQSEGDRLFIPL